MDIHAYQAKDILAGFGVTIPAGGLAYNPEQAVCCAREIGGEKWMVKARIHSGGRGKAGGIKVCVSLDEIWEAAEALLGKRLVTHQTGARGKVVYRLYVEAATELDREMYFVQAVRKLGLDVPLVVRLAGKGRRMGHAGAIISASGESAAQKVAILEASGIEVAPSPAELGTTMQRVLEPGGRK